MLPKCESILKRSKTIWIDQFKEFDLDDNGKITFDEIYAVVGKQKDLLPN